LRIKAKIPTRLFVTCLFLGIYVPFLPAFPDPFPMGSQAIASEDDPATKTGRSTTKKPAFNLGAALASFYKDHISPVDGSRCPSYPSCSSYSLQAFKKHGFLMGWIMTVDRLIHEGEEEKEVSPVVYHGGRWKIYDPVENNDFWWYDETRSDDPGWGPGFAP